MSTLVNKNVYKTFGVLILIAIGFTFLNFIPKFLGSGLNSAQPIGKFLNGNFPTTTPNNNAPALLSQTGAFSDLNALTPSSGVIPYDMIQSFWSDGADKHRWIAVPNDGTPNGISEQIQFSEDGNWQFPKGSVMIKHFELGGKRLETRFEVKGDDDIFYYLTYKWNDAQTDAELLLTGLDEDILVNGVVQTWHYPSVSECQSCHLTEVGSVLGLRTRFLNKNITYPSTGLNANQLVTLSHIGLVNQNITDTNVNNYTKIAAIDDPNASLELRARSYIDVNCSNCHQPGTINGGMFDARITTDLMNQHLINGAVLYDEGLDNPRVIKPQDIGRSMLHHRMESLETGIAMPPLAKNVVDTEGLQLISDWINSLPPAPTAAFSATPISGTAPLEVTFNAAASEGNNLTYTWDFGDLPSQTGGTTGSGVQTTHTYNNIGSYTATLTVSNGQFTDESSINILVENPTDNGLISFSDQTNLFTSANYSGVGMAVVDMNGDKKDDIVRFNQAKHLNIQYQENTSQAFSNYNFGAVSNANQWSVCVADYDNNGLNDILTGGAYDNIKVIKNNNGNNSYTSQFLPNANIFIQGSNFVDINNDGWLDIFACHDDAESRPYQNDQNGGFFFDPNLIDTKTNPASDNSGNYASIWTDYDNDGDLDLYISKCRIGVALSSDPRRINMLFNNDGNNNFTEVSAQAGLKFGEQSWLTDFADIDNDGDMDCIVINHYENSRLMRNNGNGTFTDITNGSGLLPALGGSNLFGIQGIFRDFNNDGFVDLLVAGNKHYLFYNNGNNTFSQAPNPFNANEIESFALGDLNHDGFIDVYAGYANLFTTPSNIQDRLFINNGNNNNFINIQLEGVESNRNGIGARVEIYGSWGTQIREVRSGEGYGIMNSFTQHFGIGGASQVSKVVVRWPSGIVQEVNNPAINQFLTIVESSCVVGNPCNDNDPCTINDTFDNNCNCTGTFQDTDNDGICDANDNTNGNCMAGNPCNDNDDCTVNDTFDNNCNCTGTFQDTDNDGICDANDNTNGNCMAGNPCNDNDDCTVNDTFDNNCNCTGTFQDTDNDGICDANDNTNGNCTAGNPCNDNDDCTINDTFDNDCNCTGTFQDTDNDGICDTNDICPDDPLNTCENMGYCSAEATNTNYEFIQRVQFAEIDNNSGNDGGYGDFTNLTANVDIGENIAISLTPGFSNNIYNEAFKVWIDFNQDGDFNDGGEQVLAQTSNSVINSHINIPSTASSGMTRMRIIMKWNSTPVSPCGTITYGEVEDYSVHIGNDVSCNIGTPCDDNDPCTINDNLDNNCNCVGIFQDSDNDGICDANDTTNGNCTLGATCNDNDSCTINDSFDANCNCVGTFQDSDNDGICNADDPCPNDPNNTCNTVDYCTAQGINTNYEFIQRIQFGSIDNTSGDNDGYADFTNLSTTVNAGQGMNITLTPGFYGNPYNEHFRIWIDFNQDGDFSDAGEQVFAQSSNTILNGTINIPNNAMAGTTRMRIAMRWNSSPASACDDFPYGEVEDYSLNVETASNPNIFALNSSSTLTNIDVPTKMTLYPNPTTRDLIIRWNQTVTDGTLYIYSNSGQQVFRQLIEHPTQQQIIDVRDLVEGVYIIRMEQTDGTHLVQRFVKVK